jgi:hypothetical protein
LRQEVHVIPEVYDQHEWHSETQARKQKQNPKNKHINFKKKFWFTANDNRGKKPSKDTSNEEPDKCHYFHTEELLSGCSRR